MEHPENTHTAEANSKDIVQAKSPDVESSIAGVDPLRDVVRVVDHKAERALCRKFDVRLLPVLAFMCRLFRLDACVEPD